MKHSTGLVVAAAVLATVTGCSPATPAPDTPAVAVADGPAALPEATPGFEAVPAPAGLEGVLRVGAPIRELAAWRDLLPAHTPFGQLASLGAEAVAVGLLGSLGEQVDLSAPFDLVILEDEEERSPMVASVVLRDLGEARRAAAADFDFVPRQDGGMDVRPRKGAKATGIVATDDLACAVLRGGVPLADHLVCAANGKDLDAAGPYLARTVAGQPARDGLRFELAESVVRRRLSKGETAAGEQDASDAEAAGKLLGERLGQQVLDDFASAALEAGTTPSGVLLGADLHFRSLKSPFTAAFVGSRGQGVPATFWKVPADADLAIHFPGASRDAMRTAVGSLWTDLGETIPDDEVPRQTWRDAMAKAGSLFLTGGPLLVAHGPPAAQAPVKAASPAAVKAARPAAADPVKRHREARTAAAGWVLLAVPEPAERWTTGLREIVKIASQPTRPRSGSAGRGSAGAGPSSPSAPQKRPRRSHTTIEEVPVRPGEKLAAGALHVVNRNEPDPGYRPGPGEAEPLQAPYDNHVFVAGTPEHTWFCLSENEALARTKLREAMAAGAGGLAGRSELAPLQQASEGAAGFVTLRGLIALASDADTAGELAAAEAERTALAALPYAGLTPMFVSMAPAPAGGNGATLRVGGALSIAAALDLIRWMQR